MAEQYFCKKCVKTMGAEQFYGSNNLEKYPEGKLDMCKSCATMHVDNWNPETYMWLLQECDVPYVHDEWVKLLEKFGREGKVTGMTIFGRYLSKMKLKQFKDYRWKDTEFLQELADSRLEQTMKRQGYSAAEITVAQEQKKIIIPEEGFKEPPPPPVSTAQEEDYFAIQSGADDMEFDLTDEEKTYLRLKWGKAYKVEEWIKLEQLYEEMMSSYDIQGAGHIDTLKLVCKTSLKANQLIDMGDVEGFQKMSKVYDSLMKSGKFTAAQNKAESGEFVDAIGQLVEICEKEGFIPRYYIDTPNDKVDETLADMKSYTKNLVYEELNLGNLIEQSIKTMMNEENREEDEDIEEELTLEELDQLKDEDFEEHMDFLEEESELDEETLKRLVGEE